MSRFFFDPPAAGRSRRRKTMHAPSLDGPEPGLGTNPAAGLSADLNADPRKAAAAATPRAGRPDPETGRLLEARRTAARAGLSAQKTDAGTASRPKAQPKSPQKPAQPTRPGPAAGLQQPVPKQPAVKPGLVEKRPARSSPTQTSPTQTSPAQTGAPSQQVPAAAEEVNLLMKGLMADDRYWKAGPEQGPYKDAIQQIWALAHPGTQTTDATGRPVRPTHAAVSLDTLRAEAARLLGAQHGHRYNMSNQGTQRHGAAMPSVQRTGLEDALHGLAYGLRAREGQATDRSSEDETKAQAQKGAGLDEIETETVIVGTDGPANSVAIPAVGTRYAKRPDLPDPTDEPVDLDTMHDILDYDPDGMWGDARTYVEHQVLGERSLEVIADEAGYLASRYLRDDREGNPLDGNGDAQDAVRHAIGAILAVREYGPERAKVLLDRHERKPNLRMSPSDTPGSQLQDLYNNRIGMDAAADPKYRDLDPVDIALDLYQSGKLQERPFELKR
jgi:hypothetical protein